MTKESPPSSSKKWLSTDTRSTLRTSASTSAKTPSRSVVGAPPRSSISNVGLRIWPISMFAMRLWSRGGSSDRFVEEVGQPQIPTGGNRLVVDPLAHRQIEYTHAERRENDRLAVIDGSPSQDDIGECPRHELAISSLLFGQMGRRVGLHHVL